jgi:hypothetical protein
MPIRPRIVEVNCYLSNKKMQQTLNYRIFVGVLLFLKLVAITKTSLVQVG